MSATLEVNGIQYGGWQEIRIELNMDTLAGGFTFQVSEKWPGGDRQIAKGDRCVVRADGTVVITGYVDEINPSVSASEGGSVEHSITITGRDKTGDLVDSSAINSPGQWSGVNALSIAKALCAPFGIPVINKTSVGRPFKKFNIQQGETVFDALNRMAELRGVLMYSDGVGGLVINNRATTRSADALVIKPNNDSNNVKMARFIDSNMQRFSQYIVKGQQQGSDEIDPLSSAGSKGTATDSTMRHRPLLMMAEGQANSRQCKERAEWEKRTRNGAAQNLTARVQGWRQSNGQLWAINTIAPCVFPVLKIEGDMLIKGVVFSLVGGQGGGTTTDLTLTLPEAYDRIERPEDAT